LSKDGERTFKRARLSELTGKMYDNQKKWESQIYQKTLGKHFSEIESLLGKMNLFDIWSNCLQRDGAAKKLIPEMYIDAYTSISLACFGFYKYAYMCLRSELETALNLIYFSKHPVEFAWWLQGSAWYRELTGGSHSWGKSYGYFIRLPNFKKFEKKCKEHLKLFQGRANIGKEYQRLSEFIHSGASFFQTGPERISPEYNVGKFKQWCSEWNKVQSYVNIILAIEFVGELKSPDAENCKSIVNLGVGKSYHTALQDFLGI
jgi:hypothetical protein